MAHHHHHQQVRPGTLLQVESVSSVTDDFDELLQVRHRNDRDDHMPWGVQAADDGRRAAMAVVMRRLPAGGPRMPAGRGARQVILTAATATGFSDDVTQLHDDVS